MRTKLHLGVFLALAAAPLVFGAGCGVPDLDRTQPDKVQKSVFKNADGTPRQFWFRQTVIDVPATNGVSFIGEQGDTDRIVFDITEDFLFAYRAYPHLAADDGSGDEYVRPGSGSFQGAPVAAFRIQSHFDVQRQFNPTTGEQTNVIVENTTDRPWYEREYIRVDWSTNQVADFRFGVAAVSQQPLGEEVPQEDPTHDNDKEKAVVTPAYIDVVTKYAAEPESMYFGPEWGNLPVCYFYFAIQKDCLGGTIKIRNSFRAVEESDYLPLAFDDNRFQKFGYFRTERPRFNDEYGIVEPGMLRLANRWNLWKNAADCYDPNADRPYGACEPDQLRTIVYYLNEDFPKQREMLEMAKGNADAWNDLFRQAVLAMTGWSEEDLGDHRMYTLCVNNPVQEGDPAECGPAGTNPQIGDLRYSMYYYVPDVHDWSPLGYGPSAADPLTGEIISANAFYYGSAGGFIAARTRDLVKLELGLLEGGVDDLRDGLPAREAVSRAQARAQQRMIERGLQFDEGAVRSMAQNLRVKEKAARLRHQIQSGEAFIDKRAGRLQALERTSIDEDLLTQEVKEALSFVATNRDGTQELLEPESAASLLDHDVFGRMQRIRDRRLLTPEAGGCILMAEDVFDDGLLGLVSVVKQKFYDTSVSPPVLKDGFDEEDVYLFIEARTMGDTQLHEIGHTVGLRHNFSGTSDAINFEPEFWSLRKLTMGPNDARPKKEWELTGASLNGHVQALNDGLRDTQNSTVMDYASTYGTNVDLGSYDLAAIKYAYGDMVEVFNSPDMSKDRAKLLKAGELHYTYYPELVSNAGDYDTRVAAIYDRRDVNYRKTDPREPLFDESLVEAPYLFCSDEYNHASAICATWDQGADNYERTVKLAEDYRNYYIFDAFKRERLTFGIYIWDYLSRVYTRKYSPMLDQYKNWVNDEFIIRDDKPCVWFENGQQQSDPDRFVADACGLAGFLGTVELVNLFAEVIQAPDVGCYVRLNEGCYDAPVNDERGFEEGDTFLVDANPDACDAYVPTQPAAGSNLPPRRPLKVTSTSPMFHVRDSTTCEGWTDVVDSKTGSVISQPPVELGVGGARPANTLYDRERYGYYFYIKPIVIGSWWEKWLAVKAMGDSETDFIGVDASSDTRSFLISLNLLFGEQINNLVGGVLTETPEAYGPVLDPQTNDVKFVPLISPTSGGTFDRSALSTPSMDPDQQYTFRLLAMMNAAYQGQYTDDLEFGESLRVATRYSTTNVDIPDDVRNDPTRYTELTDPVTGLKWYALKQLRGDGQLYSIGYEYIRKIKDKYYVGGADGPGTELLPALTGEGDQFQFLVRQEIRILQNMRSTAGAFGYSSVWEGDLPL